MEWIRFIHIEDLSKQTIEEVHQSYSNGDVFRAITQLEEQENCPWANSVVSNLPTLIPPQDHLFASTEQIDIRKYILSRLNKIPTPSLEESERIVGDFLTDSSQPTALKPLAAPAQALLEPRATIKLQVAFLGEFSAGKSCLINSLLGQDILPEGMVPVTCTVIKISYGTSFRITFKTNDSVTESIDPTQLERLVDQRVVGDADIVQEINIQFPAPILEHIDIIDTPGFNSGDKLHDQTAWRLLMECDIVFWTFSAHQIAAWSEDVELRGIEELQGKVIGLLNKIDRIKKGRKWSSEETQRHTQRLKERFPDLLSEVIPVSAKWIKSEDPRSGHTELVKRLLSIHEQEHTNKRTKKLQAIAKQILAYEYYLRQQHKEEVLWLNHVTEAFNKEFKLLVTYQNEVKEYILQRHGVNIENTTTANLQLIRTCTRNEKSLERSYVTQRTYEKYRRNSNKEQAESLCSSTHFLEKIGIFSNEQIIPDFWLFVETVNKRYLRSVQVHTQQTRIPERLKPSIESKIEELLRHLFRETMKILPLPQNRGVLYGKDLTPHYLQPEHYQPIIRSFISQLQSKHISYEFSNELHIQKFNRHDDETLNTSVMTYFGGNDMQALVNGLNLIHKEIAHHQNALYNAQSYYHNPLIRLLLYIRSYRLEVRNHVVFQEFFSVQRYQNQMVELIDAQQRNSHEHNYTSIGFNLFVLTTITSVLITIVSHSALDFNNTFFEAMNDVGLYSLLLINILNVYYLFQYFMIKNDQRHESAVSKLANNILFFIPNQQFYSLTERKEWREQLTNLIQTQIGIPFSKSVTWNRPSFLEAAASRQVGSYIILISLIISLVFNTYASVRNLQFNNLDKRAATIGWTPSWQKHYPVKDINNIQKAMSQAEKIQVQVTDLQERSAALDWSLSIDPMPEDWKDLSTYSDYIDRVNDDVETTEQLHPKYMALLKRANNIEWYPPVTYPITQSDFRSLDIKVNNAEYLAPTVALLTEKASKYDWTPTFTIPYTNTNVQQINKQLNDTIRLNSQIKEIENKSKITFTRPYSDLMPHTYEVMTIAEMDTSPLSNYSLDDFSVWESVSIIEHSNSIDNGCKTPSPLNNCPPSHENRLHLYRNSKDLTLDTAQFKREQIQNHKGSQLDISSEDFLGPSDFSAKVAMANKLSSKMGFKRCYEVNYDTKIIEDCNGWRAPLEEEWLHLHRAEVDKVINTPTQIVDIPIPYSYDTYKMFSQIAKQITENEPVILELMTEKEITIPRPYTNKQLRIVRRLLKIHEDPTTIPFRTIDYAAVKSDKESLQELDVELWKIMKPLTTTVTKGTARWTCIDTTLCDYSDRKGRELELSEDLILMKDEISKPLYQKVMYGNYNEDLCVENRETKSLCAYDRFTWENSILFANALSTQMGMEECYYAKNQSDTPLRSIIQNVDRSSIRQRWKCRGWRLPTESEWKYTLSTINITVNDLNKLEEQLTKPEEFSKSDYYYASGYYPSGIAHMDLMWDVPEWIWGPTSKRRAVFVGGGVRQSLSFEWVWYPLTFKLQTTEADQNAHIGARLVRTDYKL